MIDIPSYLPDTLKLFLDAKNVKVSNGKKLLTSEISSLYSISFSYLYHDGFKYDVKVSVIEENGLGSIGPLFYSSRNLSISLRNLFFIFILKKPKLPVPHTGLLNSTDGVSSIEQAIEKITHLAVTF